METRPMPTLHGKSRYMALEQDGSIVAAEFHDFAPANNVCCACLAPDAARERTYFHVFANKAETNVPLYPCGPCSTENCLIDRVQTWYFDKPPHRTGMCCFCIPGTCCGPPVMFSVTPYLCPCGICPLSEYCGDSIWHSPCDMFGCQKCICCGGPCYQWCALPIMLGVKNPDAFLAKYKKVLELFKAGPGGDIPDSQFVRFAHVKDAVGMGDVGDTSSPIQEPTKTPTGSPPVAEMAERAD